MGARINRRKKRTYNSSESSNQNGAKRVRITGSSVPYQVKISPTPKPFQFKTGTPFWQKYNDNEFDHSQFESTSAEDLLNKSTELYEQLWDDSSDEFRAKHLIFDEPDRQKILKHSRHVGKLLTE